MAIIGLVATGGVVLLRPQGPSTAAGVVPVSAESRMIDAAETALRGRLRQAGELRFGAMQVFDFGPADERAVCGTVRPASGGPEAPFVLRVLLPRSESLPGIAPRYQTVMEQGPGLPHAGAQAAARYCRDQSAPAAEAPMAAAPAAMPPLAYSGASATPAAATFGGGAPGAAVGGGAPGAAAETVVVRSPARLRTAPGGDVQRVAAAGEALAVIGRAPGGWVQVDTNGTQGWVHGSLLETAP
ncbi:MAG: SH3 domain-containing protein [Acetobacteraceae bacterium]|nr:MAG: SH3 domain-containing protein [Acetobacteraceae bacterium]